MDFKTSSQNMETLWHFRDVQKWKDCVCIKIKIHRDSIQKEKISRSHKNKIMPENWFQSLIRDIKN